LVISANPIKTVHATMRGNVYCSLFGMLRLTTWLII